MIELIIIVLVLAGILFSLLSSLGFLRLPDVYTRIHAGAKGTTMGTLLILVGAFIYFWYFHSTVSIRLILGIVFVFLTSPVAGQLVIRAAYRSGVPLADISVKDDLRDELEARALRANASTDGGTSRTQSHDQINDQSRGNTSAGVSGGAGSSVGAGSSGTSAELSGNADNAGSSGLSADIGVGASADADVSADATESGPKVIVDETNLISNRDELESNPPDDDDDGK